MLDENNQQSTQAEARSDDRGAVATEPMDSDNGSSGEGHFGAIVGRIKAPSNQGKVVAGVVSGVAVVVLIFMIFGGHGAKKTEESRGDLASTDSFQLEQNAARLHHFGEKSAIPASAFNFSSAAPAAPSRDMEARQNAPTQMYQSARRSGDGSRDGDHLQTLSGGDGYSQFANQQKGGTTVVKAKHIAHPKTTIAEGEFIRATLETAINSDLPGRVRAVVNSPVYGYTGMIPLIPAGSRLIGQYANLSGNGSATSRVFVMWNRVITPSGLSIALMSPGSDSLGRAGMGADAVDSHFFKIFGSAALLSVIAATTASSGVSSTDQPNSADMYRQSIAMGFQQAANQSLQRNLGIKPTLHLHQGDPITVFVAHDLEVSSGAGDVE